MTRLFIAIATILCAFSCFCEGGFKEEGQFISTSPVGYRIGQVVSRKLLRTSQSSKLYQLVVPQLDDNRPIKLISLQGTHYQIGYDYGFLLADQIQYSYQVLFQNQFKQNTTLLTIFQIFFDWQYHSYIRKNLPIEFINQIKGIKDGAFKAKRNTRIKKIIQRVLVLSSIPSTFWDDVPAVLQDELFRVVLRIRNQQVENYLQANVLYVVARMREYFKKMAIQCSFFGVWGTRTRDGELYTSRNLDWTANTGINLNKLITIFTITNTIPHATVGYPGLLGAITGISSKGITTHQAGQASDLETLDGFQWTMRMRYLLGNANNLGEAIRLWEGMRRTLGMNFMVGSAGDRRAVVFEEMRGYGAMFMANDPRQNHTIFQDPSGQLYVAGFSMPDALYRTNHAYDQLIRKHSHTKLRKKDSSTISRYFIQRDMLRDYESRQVRITEVEAVNMTAIMGAKEKRNYYRCGEGARGSNVISVAYYPKDLMMWAAWEYGANETFRSACCGVYVKIDLKPYFGITSQQSTTQSNKPTQQQSHQLIV